MVTSGVRTLNASSSNLTPWGLYQVGRDAVNFPWIVRPNINSIFKENQKLFILWKNGKLKFWDNSFLYFLLFFSFLAQASPYQTFCKKCSNSRREMPFTKLWDFNLGNRIGLWNQKNHCSWLNDSRKILLLCNLKYIGKRSTASIF